jgi:hypothetical protein
MACEAMRSRPHCVGGDNKLRCRDFPQPSSQRQGAIRASSSREQAGRVTLASLMLPDAALPTRFLQRSAGRCLRLARRRLVVRGPRAKLHQHSLKQKSAGDAATYSYAGDEEYFFDTEITIGARKDAQARGDESARFEPWRCSKVRSSFAKSRSASLRRHRAHPRPPCP